MAVDFENIIPAVERILLISWLLKDFGWMCTDLYLGWPFGLCAIFYHFVLLLFDPRATFRFYNFSILLWVTGNYLWMSIEFISTTKSSSVHFGPDVPIATLSPEAENMITDIKIALFAISLFSQAIMYVGIGCGYLEMPKHLSEDSSALHELSNLIGGRVVAGPGRDHNLDGFGRVDSFKPVAEDRSSYPRGVSTAFVEYMYISCWILKDLIWSYGTGDLQVNNRGLAIFLETVGLFFGILALSCYVITAYIYRRSRVCFLDAMTTILWISANVVWMSGEFFVRYNNLELDDGDSGNDQLPRLIAVAFFVTGFAIQMYVLLYLSLEALCKRKDKGRMPRIEMYSYASNIRKKTASVFSAYSPQRVPQRAAEDDDEVMILF